ncbi:hypothetical protein HOC80_00335 [archaeon]|jgi:uncharacterized membrane protein|nr:hypothetical protein [archaeon]MBT4416532.1 hypothetical protein [archaeon]
MVKHNETKFQNTVMVIAFLYAGISFILGLLSLWMYFRGGDSVLLQRMLVTGKTALPVLMMQRISLVLVIVSFCSFVISLLSGMALMKVKEHHIVKEVEKKAENEISEDVLLPEEKKVVHILEDNDDAMTQKELVNESKLSKVKIHRILKRLETKKVVKKFSYGMTNRIKLIKKLKK